MAAVCGSGLAPYHAEGLDWFAGMAATGAAELRAAARGRASLEDHLASAELDPELFTPADHAALAGAWSWLLSVVEQAMEGGLGGMVPSSHGGWLARRTPSAELWLRPDDGHVSVLNAGEAALGWLWDTPVRADPRNGQVVPSDVRKRKVTGPRGLIHLVRESFIGVQAPAVTAGAR